MEVELKAGTRLRSTVCDVEVVVVKAPAGPIEVRCGGHPMVPIGDPASEGGTVEPGYDGGALIGKRYTDDEATLEVLCTKPGTGSLSLGDHVLVVKGAKPLPSSD